MRDHGSQLKLSRVLKRSVGNAILNQSVGKVKMGRAKSYDRDAVLVAARDLFWERGYEATSIADLEHRTGLNRSSLYQEFGTKHQLFQAALECYADRIISMLMEDLRQRANLEALTALFRSISDLFRSNAGVSARGCLMVNSTAELAARDERVRPAAAAYRDRLRADFARALARGAANGEIDPGSVERRANVLASTLMGIWLSARIDPLDAANLSETVAAEIATWQTT
jgi:TetR/AcrR family transcriptional regulator, transcriptional repressor for nem operon